MTQDTLFDVVPHPRARAQDTRTALDAARSITPGRTEDLIVQVLARYGPMTADEVAAKLPTCHMATVKTAIPRAGVVDSGLRRPSLRGRSSIVWRLP